MKTIKNYSILLLIVIAVPLSSVFARNTLSTKESASMMLTGSSDANRSAPPHLNLTVSVPAALESQIVRTDYDNQSTFSLKTNKEPAFLFSVTRVTSDQWVKIKGQLDAFTIIQNKDGFITFVQKTAAKEIKGSANAEYQQVIKELDAIIASIQVV